jgi:hypothetical protein
MDSDAEARSAAIALAPHLREVMDDESRDDYQSCLTAGEPQVALVLLFGFIKESSDIPQPTLIRAFQALDSDHKEEFRHLLERNLKTTA